MNNQEIQIILGILLLLIYVFFIRNKEGYRGKGRTSCQSRPVSGRRIFKRVRPMKKCKSNGRSGYIARVNRIMVPLPRGEVPVNKGRKVLSRRNAKATGPALRDFMNKITYEGARKGANYMEKFHLKQGNNTTTKVDFYRGASRATRSTARSRTMKNNMKAKFILPPDRARVMNRQRRDKNPGFIERCKNMFRRRKIPFGATQQMIVARNKLTPEQWARDDKK